MISVLFFGHFGKWTSALETVSSSRLEVFLRKGILKICSKFTREHPWWSAISIKLYLLHIFRTSFLKNTSGWLLLESTMQCLFWRKNRASSLWSWRGTFISCIYWIHLALSRFFQMFFVFFVCLIIYWIFHLSYIYYISKCFV